MPRATDQQARAYGDAGPGHVQWARRIGGVLNVLAPRVGLHPDALLALARLETGRRNWAAEHRNYWGFKGEYGPAFARRAAELFGLPLQVSRSYSHESPTWEEYDGQRVRISDTFRSYPTDVHSVADLLRLLHERYDCATRLARYGPEAQIIGIWCGGYATSTRWPRSVIDLLWEAHPPSPSRRRIIDQIVAVAMRDRDAACEVLCG